MTNTKVPLYTQHHRTQNQRKLRDQGTCSKDTKLLKASHWEGGLEMQLPAECLSYIFKASSNFNAKHHKQKRPKEGLIGAKMESVSLFYTSNSHAHPEGQRNPSNRKHLLSIPISKINNYDQLLNPLLGEIMS